MTVINAAASGSSFQPIKPRCKRLQTDHSEPEEEEDAGIESPSAESQAPALFSCPEGGCARVYTRYKNLENHLACGNHKRISEKETFPDKTKILYGECLSSDVRPVPSLSTSVFDVPVDEIQPKGWALAKKRAQVRFQPSRRIISIGNLMKGKLARETEGLQNDIMTLVDLKHPIISYSYNLCELVRNNMLKDLSLSVLK